MASVSKDDIPNVAGFMPDFWELMKKYYITEDDQHYWDALIDDSTRLDTGMGEEKERRLCHMLLLAYLEFLKEEAKHGGENTGSSEGTGQAISSDGKEV